VRSPTTAAPAKRTDNGDVRADEGTVASGWARPGLASYTAVDDDGDDVGDAAPATLGTSRVAVHDDEASEANGDTRPLETWTELTVLRARSDAVVLMSVFSSIQCEVVLCPTSSH
jgi:hypothetical protein